MDNKHLPEYVTPQVDTYTEEELLEEVGSLQAYIYPAAPLNH